MIDLETVIEEMGQADEAAPLRRRFDMSRTAFVGDGEIVPTVEPAFYADEPETPSGEPMVALLRLVTQGVAWKKSGQWVHILAYTLGIGEYRSLAELAKFMGVSPGRISQLIREMPMPLQVVCQRSPAKN